MPRLTRKLVETLEPKPADYSVRDSEVIGLGVRVRPSGSKSYILTYRLGGQLRKLTLGRADQGYPIDEARERAREALQDVRDGIDPQIAKVADRNALTVSGLIDLYVKALAALRERIASGALNGGDPVVVMLEAEALDLSPTPLREALARLEGEGLVRRVHRGGYRVAQLGAGEIAEHYRFQSRLVATSLEVGPFQPLKAVSGLLTPEAAASALADLLGEVVRRPGDRAVRDAWLASTGRMARIRRREPGVLEGLVEEFEAVSAALGADAASAAVAVGKVYRRRIEAAGRLSDAAAPAE